MRASFLVGSGSRLTELWSPPVKSEFPRESLICNFFLKTRFIEVELPYKIVIICAAQQSDSLLHVPTSILFQALFPHR